MTQVVNKYVSDPQIADALTTRMIDAPMFSASVATVLKNKFEKGFLQKVKKEECFVKSATAVYEKKINEEDGILTRKVDSFRSSNSPTDISDKNKTNPTD